MWWRDKLPRWRIETMQRNIQWKGSTRTSNKIIQQNILSTIFLPTVNRASNRPSCDLAEAVKLLQDSSTRFFPRLDLRLEATRASNTAAWPLSSTPPGTTFREPIPSWKKRKWLSGNKRASLSWGSFWVGRSRSSKEYRSRRPPMLKFACLTRF